MKHLFALVAVGLVLAASATPVQAAIIFSQNFEVGLGANESTGGAFTRNNTNANGNGTFMMGHPGTYANNVYDFYQVQLDLTNYTSATLSFDFRSNIEGHFDRFNLLASTGAIAPPNGLLSPTGVSGLQYTNEGDLHHPNLGQIAFANGAFTSTQGVFDLSAFAGQIVNVRFQFGSDFSIVDSGTVFDNILVVGTPTPEPATLAVFGLMAAGAFGVRRRLKATV